MQVRERLNGWLAAIITLFGLNWITLFGAVLSAVSALLILGFLLLGVFQMTNSPYIGIMAFLILPVVFVVGLLIIPVGAWFHRRRLRKAGPDAVEEDIPPFPVINLNNPNTRRIAGVVMILTVFNLLLISTVTYKGVVYMDSVEFCGKVCHSVMKPEHTAYLNSPHSRVECVDCHIGPGAPWFVRSKLSGMRQVFAVMFNTYEKPIPVPVENLRPSRDTCEHCHWPKKFAGDRVRVITRFQEDEENTATKTVLLMHIGGGASEAHGIHSWHIDPSKRTTYVAADKQRQEIVRVRVEESNGNVLEFKTDEFDESMVKEEQVRVMDCIDCHNRPTHIFKMPAQAMDESMADGLIDPSLPYIKKVGVDALQEAVGADNDLQKIEEDIRSYYSKEYPDLAKSESEVIDTAVREIQNIYDRNVFPGMDVGWGTYPNNIGHETSPGCFRCHNDSLKAEDGTTVGQDCMICHTVLAWDEEDPEILEQLEIQ